MKARLASTSDSIDRSTLGCTTQHIPERLIILLANLTVKLNQHSQLSMSSIGKQYSTSQGNSQPILKKNPTMPSTVKQAKTTAYESVQSNPFTRVHGQPTRSNYETIKSVTPILNNDRLYIMGPGEYLEPGLFILDS